MQLCILSDDGLDLYNSLDSLSKVRHHVLLCLQRRIESGHHEWFPATPETGWDP